MTSNVPTSSNICPAWCTTNHEPFEGTNLLETADEISHTSRGVRIEAAGGRTVDVSTTHSGSDPEPLVFVTVNRMDVLHVRSAEARGVGQALVEQADAIDNDIREQLEHEGIIVNSSARGVIVTYTDADTMTPAQRSRFEASLRTSWRDIVKDLRNRRESTS